MILGATAFGREEEVEEEEEEDFLKPRDDKDDDDLTATISNLWLENE